MFDNIVVAICVIICLVAGIWGSWLENGPSKGLKKDKKENMDTPEKTHGKKEE